MKAVSIDDLRRRARSKVPKIFFDYLDGGAGSETTLQHNVADFDDWVLHEQLLSGVANVDLTTTFFGDTHALPFMLGPIGFAGMLSRRGEIAAGQAADRARIAQCLSTFSICSLEDVAATRAGPLYFQLYVFRRRELTEDMVERARSAGVKTLVITVDTPVSAPRERDERNGFRARNFPTFGMLASMLTHPLWCIGAISNGVPRIGNIDRYDGMGRWVIDQSAGLGKQIDPTLTWKDLRWFRDLWDGRMIIKGIMSTEDAAKAIDAGADGLIVSNHGGRALDPVQSSIRALPGIVKAVGSKTEIVFDGGIRRGADIVKALALGACGVSLGRAYAYGLGADGEGGVTRAIELLRTEMSAVLALMGIDSIARLRSLGPDALRELPGRP
ncbi:alpha-hydroxy acid oxidase [Caballeronia sp. DA-9]|uniref:alpha-hydroxy acid oxidase n=1 Tax=Caballeronia sp. DA-9 TaxID=3436237 RepID=UPI003F666DD2